VGKADTNTVNKLLIKIVFLYRKGHRCLNDKTAGLSRGSELSDLDCTWNCKGAKEYPLLGCLKSGNCDWNRFERSIRNLELIHLNHT
jgi:hypothetical protein